MRLFINFEDFHTLVGTKKMAKDPSYDSNGGGIRGLGFDSAQRFLFFYQKMCFQLDIIFYSNKQKASQYLRKRKDRLFSSDIYLPFN